MSLKEGLFPTTHERERGPGRGSSEDDRETRHAPSADPGSGSGIPRREPGNRPATADSRRRLRVRGEDRATVRLRPAGEGRQGPAAPLPGQGDRPVSGSDHPPVASASDHRRDRRPARRPRAARSRVATPTPTSDCWPRSTRCTARCPVRPRASCAPAPSISSATACSAASITFCRWTTTILAG